MDYLVDVQVAGKTIQGIIIGEVVGIKKAFPISSRGVGKTHELMLNFLLRVEEKLVQGNVGVAIVFRYVDLTNDTTETKFLSEIINLIGRPQAPLPVNRTCVIL